jgi:Amt family ammonium transporter
MLAAPLLPSFSSVSRLPPFGEKENTLPMNRVRTGASTRQPLLAYSSCLLPQPLLFVLFFNPGYAFAFGGQDNTTATTFIGTSGFVTTGPSSAFWFFQYTFSATSVTVVAGTLAERCQMAAYLCYSVVLAGFIYPVIAHALWSNNGFLSSHNVDPLWGSGAIDFAGSGVVHLTGGATALYATSILGPRRGRFHDSQGDPLETPKSFPGHSVALQLLGTMILWFGWFGFNAGSALTLDNEHFGEIASNAAVSTALSGAMGGISALFTNLVLEERRTGEPSFSMLMTMNGALSGLVAITGGCAVVEPWSAVVIGLVSGWLYIIGTNLLIRWRIDDAVDAIPVHMFNGMWGLLSTGLLASPRKLEFTYGSSKHPGFFYGMGRGDFNAVLLANQLVSIAFILGWTFFTMFPFFVWLNYKGWLRSDSLEELVGLDISYHGGAHFKEGGSVKKEYVEAYNKHKGTLRQRHQSGTSRSSGSFQKESSDMDMDIDPEMDEEAAAEETMEE